MGVQGYPTLKFFRNGVPSDYGGGRTAADIVSWLNKKTGPPAKALATEDELKAFIDSGEVVLVGFFADAEGVAAKAFLEAAAAIDGTACGIVTDAAVAATKEIKGDLVVLFKKFDEGRNDLPVEGLSVETINAHIAANALPLGVEFTQESAQKIFGGENKNHLLLFVSKTSGEFAKIHADYKTVAAKFKGQVLFIYVDVDNAENDRILEFFGLKKEDCPTIRLINLGEEMSKFKPDLMSEDVPEDWDKEGVKVLVGKNFDQVVLDPTKAVLVEFYAPWCGHCKSLAPIWDELGAKYKDSADIVIAKMDATANELEKVKVHSFPTIKYFPAGDNKDAVDFNGARTLDGFSKFLDAGGVGEAAEEEPPVEEEELGEDEEEEIPEPKDEL